MKYVMYALIIAGIIAAALTMRESDTDKCARLVRLNNIQQAVESCTRSGEQGVADSQYILGVMYATGNGVKRNATEAAAWYSKAAQQGHVAAQYNLGYSYYNAKGVPQDYEQAFKWYRTAALQGHPDAQHNLGLAYMNGHGVSQDIVNAYAWLTIAASQGQKLAANARDLMVNNLTPEQLSQAQILIEKHGKK